MAAQVARDIGLRGPRKPQARHRENGHVAGARQERQGEGQSACRFGTAVPGDRDRFGACRRHVRRRDEDRPAAVEEGRLERRPPRLVRRRSGGVRPRSRRRRGPSSPIAEGGTSTSPLQPKLDPPAGSRRGTPARSMKPSKVTPAVTEKGAPRAIVEDDAAHRGNPPPPSRRCRAPAARPRSSPRSCARRERRARARCPCDRGLSTGTRMDFMREPRSRMRPEPAQAPPRSRFSNTSETIAMDTQARRRCAGPHPRSPPGTGPRRPATSRAPRITRSARDDGAIEIEDMSSANDEGAN